MNIFLDTEPSYQPKQKSLSPVMYPLFPALGWDQVSSRAWQSEFVGWIKRAQLTEVELDRITASPLCQEIKAVYK